MADAKHSAHRPQTQSMKVPDDVRAQKVPNEQFSASKGSASAPKVAAMHRWLKRAV